MIRLAIALVLAAVTAAPVASQRSFTITDCKARLTVREDATLDVEEHLMVRFKGSWNGIYRDIRTHYRDGQGSDGEIRIDVDGVDGEVEWYKVEQRKRGLRVKIKVLNANNAVRRVVLRYRCQDVIRSYDGLDELYWNVTGTGWPCAIEKASATVKLPRTVPNNDVQLRAYTGRYRSTENATEQARDPISFTTKRRLGPHEGLTVVVGFPAGHVVLPGTAARMGWWWQDHWPFVIPLLAGLVWFLLWWLKGRDPVPGAIIAEYEPPEDLRPAEVGVIADDRVDVRDVSAILVDLAVRGRLTITQKGSSYVVQATQGWHEEREDDRPYEREILKALFDGETGEVCVDDKKMQLSAARDIIETKVYRHMKAKRYFHDNPRRKKKRFFAFGLFTILPLVFVGFKLGTLWYWIALALSAVVIIICSRAMPRRTRKGLEALRRVRGMEEYIRTAERERMKSLPMDTFERLLPYAVALGLHARWIEACHGLFTAPQWIATSTATFPAVFDGFVGSTNSSLGTSILRSAGASDGSSLGGGGWSGGSGLSGGFSGGGFGGGGGGGW